MAIRERLHEAQGEPVWEIAHLFPAQGEWTVEDYLTLDTNHLIEYTNGYVEVLPMPSLRHQQLVFLLQRLLWDFVSDRRLGEVLAAPLPVELWPKKFREPDIVFIAAAKVPHLTATYLRNVDLVMEVVSPDDPDRDYKTKRQEYAQAGIPEYWIVDPLKHLVTVLVLENGQYQLHGEFKPGTVASSVHLAGFTVPVATLFPA
ncbi:MAG: Uma2 family endonuclease [Caldilineaceae bacterium]